MMLPSYRSVIACVLGMAVGAAFGCRRQPSDDGASAAHTFVDVEAMRPEVEAFCGGCHAPPQPDAFPKEAWYGLVQDGFSFYHNSNRSDLAPPPMQQVASYYRMLAPATLPVPPVGSRAATARFTSEGLAAAGEPLDAESSPATSFLMWTHKLDAEQPCLLICDMQSGQVRQLLLDGRLLAESRLIAQMAHPAHAEPCDLDADGRCDLVVAELGSFLPGDHDRGEVVWLRATSGGDFTRNVLADGLGRVADVQPGDFDGDGDLDLIVAEFGWRKTGRILLLERQGEQAGQPEFVRRVLDDRAGAIHVPVVDLNQDGRLDFVALISQQHEVVVAFINRGNGTFEQQLLFAAGDPAFGSSGIQLVDMDSDGDMDVLYTNGDMLDSFYLKPYHGIHWLENRGDFPFEHHHLAAMPGVMRAIATDVDRDGDLDVLACSHVAKANLRGKDTVPSRCLWLERQPDGQFAPWLLDESAAGHLALTAGDFDGDGALDVAVGNFARQPQAGLRPLTIYWQQPATP